MTAATGLDLVRGALPSDRYVDVDVDVDVEANARPFPGYRIGGRLPAIAVRPQTAEEVARILDMARAGGLAVVPVGAHTAMTLGRPLARYDVALDTLGLDRIVEYEPADLTVTVEAGLTLAALQARLREHGQYLSVDPPPGDEVTIGGLLATARSGAWRGHLPAARDLVLGMTVALPDGTLATSGGRVVKNVTGYDLHRMHTGALGALGVIVSASFKVSPLPEATATLAVRCASLAVAERVAFEAWDRRLPLRALSILDARTAAELGLPASPVVLVEPAGVPAAVERTRREVAERAASAGATLDEPPANIWGALRRHAGRDGDANHALLRLGVPPTAVLATLEAVAASGIEGWAHLAAGSVLALGKDTDIRAIEALRVHASNVGGFLQVESAPLALDGVIDPFGAGDIELTRALKAQFDPTGVLNPGRWTQDV
jgi:glycolate oxidase FAD binding subunit